MDHTSLNVPYFSQWEMPDMTLPILSEGASALHRDPLWRNSGAETIEEYARWAVNVCGMVCLKMILAARGETHPILSLARACTAYGGYVVNETDTSIKGLIYAPSSISSASGLVSRRMFAQVFRQSEFQRSSPDIASSSPQSTAPSAGRNTSRRRRAVILCSSRPPRRRASAFTIPPATTAPVRPTSCCRSPPSTASSPIAASRSASDFVCPSFLSGDFHESIRDQTAYRRGFRRPVQ